MKRFDRVGLCVCVFLGGWSATRSSPRMARRSSRDIQGWLRRARHHPGDRFGSTRRLRQVVPQIDPRSVQGARGGLRRRQDTRGPGRDRRPVHPPRKPWLNVRKAIRDKTGIPGEAVLARVLRILTHPAQWPASCRGSTITRRCSCRSWPTTNRPAPIRNTWRASKRPSSRRSARRMSDGSTLAPASARAARRAWRSTAASRCATAGPSRTRARAIPKSSSRPARSIRRSASSASGMKRASFSDASSTSPATPPPAQAASRPITWVISKRRSRVFTARTASSCSSTARRAM